MLLKHYITVVETEHRGNSEISLRYTLIRQVDVKASAFWFSEYLRLIKTERKTEENESRKAVGRCWITARGYISS